MDPASLASALVGAQAGQQQAQLAAAMMRMNADQAASIVKVVEEAQQSIASLANVASGVGQNVNITA
jgi:hypothetical protein